MKTGERYTPLAIEPKWQKFWQDNRTYYVDKDESKPKFYTLVMFPYPSGDLHMGHMRNYTIGDLVARYRTMRGYNVMNPMGWDAFGLPAENAAIKEGIHPAVRTIDNIAGMKDQFYKMGIVFDWDREVASCMPDYYRWTQWMFLMMYHRGLAYRKLAPANWCPNDQTVLANEQVVDGRCERCGAEVVKKDLTQWFFRITSYAERLLDDLDLLDGWPDRVKTMQRNWIGRSYGAEIDFPVVGHDASIRVYTTRPDTVYGATFMVLAPEHPLVPQISTPEQRPAIDAYITQSRRETEIERMSTDKEKTGVPTGAYVTNPVNGETIPVWIADYVLVTYGTGAIMAVPGGDERDYDFALKYNLPIVTVVEPAQPIAPGNDPATAPVYKLGAQVPCYAGPGIMVNSGPLNGMPTTASKAAMIALLEAEGKGKGTTNYRLRDWLISRQRYWGAPIPIVYCPECGEVPVPVDQLPVILPTDVEFMPGGESPLARVDTFVNTTCPKCGGPAKRETDTMDTFVELVLVFPALLRPPEPGRAFRSRCRRLLDACRPVYRRHRARDPAPDVLAFFHQGAGRRGPGGSSRTVHTPVHPGHDYKRRQQDVQKQRQCGVRRLYGREEGCRHRTPVHPVYRTARRGRRVERSRRRWHVTLLKSRVATFRRKRQRGHDKRRPGCLGLLAVRSRPAKKGAPDYSQGYRRHREIPFQHGR